ncbi:ferritin-like domain-containing protein [Burkholderia multivorans]|uniref:ferritin-like domain-containing protein n=1 Tax=Burkholderia multivorans TaxID=87883 RepID=UPI001C225A9D|nr:ferritin-like domain-containing protein [Burkholderia multivorans]MBU9633530.1 ferritin-like domain-containing protein [Burkholderia multivorans]
MASEANVVDERLMEWLRDAHAMEEQAETMLSSMAGRIEHYPDIKRRIEQHIEETREQARLIRSCIERRGGSVSTMKDIGAKTMAWVQGMSGMFVSDEIVKGGMASYMFEHFEIAAYRNLIEAARVAGDIETQTICERILPEEQAMAAWLEHNMAGVVRTYLAREMRPNTTAKR